MQLARAWAWRNVLRAAYPGHADLLPAALRRLPGRGRDQRVIPAHAGDVTKVFLVKRQIPDSSYPAVTSSFLVQSIFDTAGGPARLPLRDHPGPAAQACPNCPTCRPSRSPSGPTIRRCWRSRRWRCCSRSPSAIYCLAHRVRRFWARVRQGARDPRPAAPLPAPGRRLAGGRLALPFRRLLVLPRGVRARRLGRQRDAGDERPGDLDDRPLHAGRRRRPAGAAGRDPGRALRAPPSSPSRSGRRSRWRPGR